MEINAEHHCTVIVALSGRFDANECDGFTSYVDRLRESGATDLAIDLSAVTFIDSSALAILASMARWAETNHSVFELKDPSDPVSVILEMTGLDKAFTVSVSAPEPSR